jgi:hypothetical protein
MGIAMISFDHLAVTAPTLQTGADHVQAQTGVSLPMGGEHPQMGTHNRITRFSDNTYLEIITPDPAAKAPPRPRWFNLDTVTQPGLSAWIVRTDDIDACIAKAAETGIDTGRATPLKRGSLNWRFSLRDDGSLPLDGAAPLIIQWDTPGPHPAGNMPDLGLRLDRLSITTPHADELRALLVLLGMSDLPEITKGDAVHLTATLILPNGSKATLT